MRAARLGVAASLAVLGSLTYASIGAAQRGSTGRVLTAVLGEPGATATELGDARRTSSAAGELPQGGLRVVWSRHLHARSSPPVVSRDGTVIAVGDSGDVDILSADGTDKAHVAIGAGPTSAPTVLADGTVVAVDAAGTVFGIRDGVVEYRAHLGFANVDPDPRLRAPTIVVGARGRHRVAQAPPSEEPPGVASTLPLEDGGVVVVFQRELVSLDGAGAIRARASAPMSPITPLVATAGGVAFATELGRVYEWNLRTAIDAVSERGDLGAPPPGVLVGEDGRHLLAVVKGTRLVALDLVTGVVETRAYAGANAFAGAVSIEPDGSVAFLESLSTRGTSILSVSRDGHASPFSVPLTPAGLTSPVDGGFAVAGAPEGSYLLADRAGRVAFATVDGRVGVATETTKVELGSSPCSEPAPSSNHFGVRAQPIGPFVGLVAAGPRAFLVACASGDVSLVRGD